MNNVYLQGWINIGKYGGVKSTETGKLVTKFQLASGSKENRQYFDMQCWHDEKGTQNGVVDGKYALIVCTPHAWKSDKKSGVSFNVKSIWFSPKGEGTPASQDVQQSSVYDEDIPF